MFSFIKSKNSENILRFYQSFTYQNSDWCLLLVNKNYLQNSPLTREIDIYQKRHLFQLKLALEPVKFYQLITDNGSRIFENEIMENKSTYLQNYNLFIDQLIEFHINLITNELNLKKVINPINLELEEKSLEWIRVSFKILSDALESVINDKNSANTFQLFFGLNPKTSMHEFRAIIYNLDIQYILLNDGNLRIKIYNDKDMGFGESKKPALEGDFSYRKREMFDLLIKLLITMRSSINAK